MKSNDYWVKRFELLEQRHHKKSLEFFHELETQFNKSLRVIDKEIAAWYSRYATENKVTMIEAKRLLSGRELEAFRMDVKEYIEKGQSLNTKWKSQLEQASVRVHVSRLEALRTNMQQQIELVYGNELDGLDTLMRDIYTDGYYRTAYEVMKGIGVGHSFSQLDDKLINRVLSKPWADDGKIFSERIWTSRTKLINELNNTLTQGIIQGRSPDKIISAISKRMNVSKNQAGRLIMSESAYVGSIAQHDSFKEVDVEEFEIIATLDGKTSETCRELDGNHYPLNEYKIGVTAPPFHVYCRTTTAPYFEDLGGERASRNESGDYELIEGDITYNEWKNKYIVK